MRSHVFLSESMSVVASDRADRSIDLSSNATTRNDDLNTIISVKVKLYYLPHNYIYIYIYIYKVYADISIC